MSREISKDNLSCRLELDGAVVSEIKFKDRDILFPYKKYLVGDIYKNRGGIPFLFPNAGKPVLDESTRINLKQHGFARDMVWKVLAEDMSKIVLGLNDNDETFKIFPYHFDLIMIIEVSGNTFSQAVTVNNNSKNDMPIALGFHPYFYVPIDKKDDFEFKISDFENTQYLENNGIVEFTLANIAKLKMKTSLNLKILAIWSEPNRHHICIEPWVSGENAILDVQKCVKVKPGESETFSMKLEIMPVN